FKNERTGMALTALAGPLANLIAAYLGALVFYAIGIFAPYNTVVAYILIFFNYYAMINTVLAVFNLVPIPPLDGSKILASFLSDRARFKFYQYQNVLSMVGMILLVSGTLSGPIDMAENLVYSGVRWLALVPFRMLGLA
ncbi:site-2 protease family protein, partial [Hominenteromicrobium sp.]